MVLFKVASNRSVDINMTSGVFDTYLQLYRLDSYTADSVDVSLVAEDDDSGTGTNSAVSSVSVTAASDYIIVVNGSRPPISGRTR